MKLSPEAMQRIRETIEVEEAIGDKQLASDLRVLLDVYLELVRLNEQS